VSLASPLLIRDASTLRGDARVVIDDTKLFNDKLQEWEDFYNFHRLHGGLDGQTPYERLRHKTTTPTA